MSIKTKLTSELFEKLSEEKRRIHLENMMEGNCIFPFMFKDKEYNECYKGKLGDWCATKVSKKTNKMKKYAFCDYEKPKKSLQVNNNNNNNSPVKNNAASKPKKTKVKANNNGSASKKSASKNNAAPKPTKKLKFKPKKAEPKQKLDLTLIDPNKLIPLSPKVSPTLWELPNRKTFSNWFNKTFNFYRAKKNSMKFAGKGKIDYFNHQKLVRDYLQVNSPYRGLLLFHGLGVGKTCASIAIAEGFREHREIVVLLNKSLKKNYIVNLMKCGFELFRINQHWVYHEFRENDPYKSYAEHLGISKKFMRDNNGAWFVDFSKPPNYESLSKPQQELLNIQVEEMIKKKYKFIHLDGLNQNALERMIDRREFDNKLLIIDEVHNLTNAMSKAYPGVRGRLLKILIMNAINLKLVFLSGTPMINNLFEAGLLFNLLRGYMYTFKFNIESKSGTIKWKNIESILLSHANNIDQIFSRQKDKEIVVTRTPLGFVNVGNGVVKSDENNMTNEEFKKNMISLLNRMGYNVVSSEINSHTAFPDNDEEFMKLFFNERLNEIKNPMLLQSRLLGLVSFFKTQDKSLLPTVVKNVVIEVPMSDYQFLNYSLIRKAEIEQDKSRGKTKQKKKSKDPDPEENIFDEKKSSYRAYSRMHCSFVFPESVPRPYPGDIDEEEVPEFDHSPEELDAGSEPLATDKKMVIKQYEKAKAKALRSLEKIKDTHLSYGEETQLLKYSPKYNTVLENIQKTKGNVFVYTEYKTLEGIAVFQIVLKANGYAPFILGKNEDDEYIQIFENEDDVDKPKYGFWGGNAEESDIIRKVFNNEFEELPKSLYKQIMSSGKNNLRGDIIKILLTTKTGAEGIDLHNVRQVHIIEPYWNPVRTKQVEGRAVRVGSHVKLPPAERNVEIYKYLSVMTKEQLKSDKVIQADSDGNTSDQVLHEISSKKLQIMEHLLQLIKEGSIDCNINIDETRDDASNFSCLSYGTNPDREDYAFVPNIYKEHIDTERKRRVIKTKWTPVFISIPLKSGEKMSFAVKQAPKGQPNILYDAEMTKIGQPGKPLGEFTELANGKKSFKFY